LPASSIVNFFPHSNRCGVTMCFLFCMNISKLFENHLDLKGKYWINSDTDPQICNNCERSRQQHRSGGKTYSCISVSYTRNSMGLPWLSDWYPGYLTDVNICVPEENGGLSLMCFMVFNSWSKCNFLKSC
jgi:hypothetical protein